MSEVTKNFIDAIGHVVSKNKPVHPDIIHHLLVHGDIEPIEALKNDNASAKTIQYIHDRVGLYRNSPQNKYHIAKHSNTPEPILEKLALYGDQAVHEGLGHNKKLPSHIVGALADSQHDYSQFYAAQHRNATPEILNRIARKTTNPNFVRVAALVNLSTPTKTLEDVYHDEKTHPDIKLALHNSSIARKKLRLR